MEEKQGLVAQKKKSTRRGFAGMDPARLSEVARAGGRAAHAQGKAHQFTAEEAQAAGRKGGEVVARDRAHMARIGSLGGSARVGLRKRQEREEAP
jgi:general stress protein YciG